MKLLKKFPLFLFLFFIPCLLFSQSGFGYINYKSYKTHYGNGDQSNYPRYPTTTSDFDKMVDSDQPATTLTNSGEISPFSLEGLNNGQAPRWGNDYYSVVYSGWFKPDKTGTYKFRTKADDASQTRFRVVGSTEWQIVTEQFGCCSYVYGTASLDNSQWYEFEIR